MKKYLLLVALVVFIIGAGWYANSELEIMQKKSYIELSSRLTNELNNEKRFSENTGIINAISIAENIGVQKALLSMKREPAIKILQKMKTDFAKKTSIKNLKVHIHTKDTKSFIRSWKLNKFGDDLSGFRKAIVRIKVTNEPFFGFEIGRIGLTLRSMVPILHDGGFIGSLEVIQNFDNVVKVFKRKNYNYLLLMDSSLLNIAKYLKDAPKVGTYVLSSRMYDKDFLKSSQSIDFAALKKDGYFISDKYFYSYEDIKSTGVITENIGMHLLAMPIEDLHIEIEKNKENLFSSMATYSVFIFLIIGMIMLLSILISSSRR